MASDKLERRDFLKITAAATVAGAAMRMASPRALASSTEGSSPHKWVMIIDQEKCVGCGQCVLACRANNDVPPEISWTRVLKVGKSGDRDVFLPRPCMHCDNAPCVEVCPVKASYKRADGIVMMDYDRCIGCRYCEVACPYGARAFNWKSFTEPNPAVPTWGEPGVERRPRGVVEKCSFCYNRIDRGLEMGLVPGEDPNATPACVVACPMGARLFGDLNDPESQVSKILANSPAAYRLRADLGTEPRVYYLPIRSGGYSEVELEEVTP
jgi:Fe-S-cluster-containing dehydrogenase component